MTKHLVWLPYVYVEIIFDRNFKVNNAEVLKLPDRKKGFNLRAYK